MSVIRAFFGAGIQSVGQDGNAVLTLSNCTLHANSSEEGGAIRAISGNNGNASVRVSGCTITGNTAGIGAGIEIVGPNPQFGAISGSASLQIVNSTLQNNSANTQGGGLFSYFSVVGITNS